MDREAAVIRSEMSQTRQALDQKLTRLEARAHELSPKRYAREHMPEYLLDRAIGGVLTLIGMRMAWGMYKRRGLRRERVRTALQSYDRW